jgi:hypothetical protein
MHTAAGNQRAFIADTCIQHLGCIHGAHKQALSAAAAAAAAGPPVCLRGHAAIHHRHVHASLLPHIAVSQHTGDAATAVLAGPRVLVEGLAIDLADCCADGVLGVTDDLLKLGADAAGRV